MWGLRYLWTLIFALAQTKVMSVKGQNEYDVDIGEHGEVKFGG